MRVLLIGATGFVGKHIGAALVARGHEVVALVRRRESTLPFPCEQLTWAEASSSLYDIDGAIHLAGENIAAGRWTRKRKMAILSSRVDSTKLLWEILGQTKGRAPQVLLAASAIGFYGNRGHEELHENAHHGDDFLADVCVTWEHEIFARSTLRVVAFRLGMVIGADGGALAKMLPIFRRGLGSVLGNGKQWVSWIHINDLADLFVFALENPEMKGIFNAVAPIPVQNRVFTESLCHALGVRKFPPVPALALKVIFGGMSALFLNSQRVSCAKLLQRGFVFRFSTIHEALAEAVK